MPLPYPTLQMNRSPGIRETGPLNVRENYWNMASS